MHCISRVTVTMRMASQRIVVECAANIPSARCRRVYIPRTPFEPCRLLRTATTLWSNVEKSEPVDRNLEKLREARSGIHSVIPISDVEIDVVGQWTDIEGNFDYFCKLVNRSEVVRWSDGPGSALELVPRSALVFGGDCFDKGCGDIRISSLLVDLKQRHPDRVVLLLGNRDVNKMRFASELHHSDLARPIAELPAPYYMGDYGRPAMEYLTSVGWEDSDVNRLRYMLRHTMGSPDAFELRRVELALLNGCRDIRDITDTIVFESFARAVQEDGIYRRYVEHAQIAAVVGNTLFVHGAVSPKSVGFVPCPRRTRHRRNAEHEIHALDDGGSADPLPLERWVSGLNWYASVAMEDWVKNPLWDASRDRRGGEALMAYAHYLALRGRSVMVSSFLRDGNLAYVSNDVAAYLFQNGIKRVVVGHKPYGDSPGVVRMPIGRQFNAADKRWTHVHAGNEPTIEIVCADTSFSDTSAVDNRGIAASEVLVYVDNNNNSQLRVHGTLHDGRPIDFRTPVLSNTPDVSGNFQRGDAHVGTCLDNGFWVKAKVADASPTARDMDASLPPGKNNPDTSDATYVAITASGYDVTMRDWSSKEISGRVARQGDDN